MNGTLFQEPISALIEQKLYEAKMWAERLPEESLTSDKLAEELTKIAHFQFDVAKLKPDERKGKRRTEKRKISDYGRDVTIDVDIIDVIIPFDGYPKSFQIAPSHCNVIDIPAMITHENGLRISLPDDQNLDRAVNFFIERVSGNLSTLEKELQNVGPQCCKALSPQFINGFSAFANGKKETRPGAFQSNDVGHFCRQLSRCKPD